VKDLWLDTLVLDEVIGVVTRDPSLSLGMTKGGVFQMTKCGAATKGESDTDTSSVGSY